MRDRIRTGSSGGLPGLAALGRAEARAERLAQGGETGRGARRDKGRPASDQERPSRSPVGRAGDATQAGKQTVVLRPPPLSPSALAPPQRRSERRARRVLTSPAGTRSRRRDRRSERPARGPLGWLALLFTMALVVAVAAGVFVGVQAFRPVPAPRLVRASTSSLAIPGRRPTLPWPGSGESGVLVPGLGTLGPVGGSKPVPIGSVAKIMTAYVVLRDHPLASPAAQGPSMTVTPADVALYRRELAQGDSVAAVAAGEHLTERQALEALLIPSGDNIANLLARWDAGSLTAFLHKMNAAAAALGMRHTHYADASGLSSRTVSTPSDQLILAPRAMAIPAFARIVRKSQVILPVAGLVTNYNTLLGKDGIVGIKTGSTPAAAGCFVFLARRKVNGHRLDIYGTLLGVTPGPGQGLITAALQASQRLLAGVVATIKPVTALPAGTRVGRVVSAWGGSTPVRTTAPVTLVGWPGLRVHVLVRHYGPALLPRVPPDAEVGQAQVSLGSQRAKVPLRTTRGFPSPSLGWRLGRL